MTVQDFIQARLAEQQEWLMVGLRDVLAEHPVETWACPSRVCGESWEICGNCHGDGDFSGRHPWSWELYPCRTVEIVARMWETHPDFPLDRGDDEAPSDE